MNNTAWQNGRKRAAKKYKERFGKEAFWGFEHLRIHDLKHTFGRRLRAARVPAAPCRAYHGLSLQYGSG